MVDNSPRTEDVLQAVAHGLQKVFNGDAEISESRTGFVLLAFGIGQPGISNYVSNCDRASMIEALRETADRLEKKQDNVRVPTPDA